ncbi:hypothetical protein yc1106_09751 [Curvularia clavata]|uniref:Uncharacterized protein n=1 Tax=Curvularia clavata TaxID=95742 RepID=A0A9Q9DX21_CURCL|nr:hypothetical protein yc1106_09751 [Curvularia clavata]
MNGESGLVTPRTQAPPIAPSQSETPEAPAWRDDDSQSATPDRHAHVENKALESKTNPSTLPPSNPTMAVPAKSGSLLSQISAMVSDEGSVPVSRNSIRRSTPSTTRRMRPAFSSRRSRAPAQIQEENPASHRHRAPNGQGNDLDLYADGDGIVKDLCDETGKPLRLAEAGPAPQHESTKSEAANVEAARESQDAEQPRYSTERPMSFIAGSTDQDGKPQDQINQPTIPDDVRVFRASGQHGNHVDQRHSSQQGTVYSDLPAPHLDPPRSPVSSPATPGTPPPKNALRALKSPDPTLPARHEDTDQSQFSGEANSRELLSQTQGIHGQPPQNTHVSDLALYQPQAKRVPQIPQIIPDHAQEPTPRHPSERQNAEQGSENQLGFQQQDWQSTISAQSSVHETSKAREKSSSRTKMSTKFKMFGGSSHPSSQHRSSEDNKTIDSNVSAEKQEHSKFFSSKSRQGSDQVSQSSQRSFFDRRKHKEPAPIYSIPYHQFQSTANVQNPPIQPPQPDAMSASKKRFSGLGLIFGKDGPSADSATKLSSPKEDKKALKAQKRAAQPRISHERDPVQEMYRPLQERKPQQVESPRQSVAETRSERSAFLSTKQLAQEHQAQQRSQHAPQAGNQHIRTSSLGQQQAPRPDLMHRAPSDPPREYYRPNAEQPHDERGAYIATLVARQQHEQLQAQRQREQAPYVQGHPRDPRYEQQPQPLPSHSIQQPQSGHPAQQPWLGPNSPSRPEYGYNIQYAAPPEPRYEAPPIPAAYSHVSGAYTAPSARQEQPMYPPQHVHQSHALPSHTRTQFSDPWTPIVSPLMSPQSHMHPSHFTYSDANTMHLVSPLVQSAPPPNPMPHPNIHRAHRPRMSSISEVQQQDRPWHLNLPAGATEQEIVRARQGQYMQDLFNAQQQQQAERAARSPSPHTAPQQQMPNNTAPHDHAHGGFREILPTSSSQAYANPRSGPPYYEQPLPTRRHPAYEQQIPVRPESSPQPAAYPLPPSRNSMRVTSPSDPPPKTPHSPSGTSFHDTQTYQTNGHQHYRNPTPTDHAHQDPQDRAPQYDAQVPEEAPPSYDGIGVPNEGMNKSRPDAVRPPNINTDVDREINHEIDREEPSQQRPNSRPRQPSIGMLQHPQPASMAASPQRTLSDMGAESLRRQLLQQENILHMERLQREQTRREAMIRERQEREAARARARELERSVSSGGQVSSLHSVRGSFNSSSAASWDQQQRGGQNGRQVFELSALEDDEPVMKATSYPGQEWVPPVWDV